MIALSWIISNIVLATLVGAAAWLVQRWLRRPAAAHVLWVIALIKLITPPLVTVPLREPPTNMACALGTCNCAAHQSSSQNLANRLTGIALTVWVIGTGATAWLAWNRAARFRRLLAYSSPAPREWQTLAEQLAAELGLRRTPEVLVAPSRLPPLVIPGWRRSRILLPQDLLGSLNGSQRVAMLLHELIHVRRGDHWVRMLEATVRATCWWLPPVSWVCRQLRACEEACCDRAVVDRRPNVRRDYASLLLDVLEFSARTPRQTVAHATAMSAFAIGLETRLREILHGDKPRRRMWPVIVLALLPASVILPVHLRYDVVPGPTYVAPAADASPVASATSSTDDDRDGKWSKVGCCPS
ncbi:MAG TPA: M56 family metallopeptidase [Gemmataceae bacterium]|jgi:beta-lactamase regulating signal transducer with metallopeptidase domain|nr:M56 family metallopeptidase [Gemmataceae bacterium]